MTLFEKKGDGVLRQRNPVKYAFIKRHRHRYSIGLMCRLLGVSRNGYYHYLTHGKRKEDKKLVLSIKAVFRTSCQTYGSRRIREALRREYGLIVSRRRIGRIMQKEGFVAKCKGRKRIKTTDSNHNLPTSPNLLERRFIGLKPNQVYVGDITYIKTKRGMALSGCGHRPLCQSRSRSSYCRSYAKRARHQSAQTCPCEAGRI